MADDVEYTPPTAVERGVWSQEEHDKFLEAVTQYPNGPWKAIAALIGTRSVRQVQTHAQKYQEKVNRRQRGLQKNRQRVQRTEHRVEEATYDFLQRPRAVKGRKRGKYNKRNPRVAPIPPRPRTVSNAVAAAAAVSAQLSSGSASAPPSPKHEDIVPPPSVASGGDDAPLPSPNEVHSPDIFKDHAGEELLRESDQLFQLDSPALPPLVADGSPLLTAAEPEPETIDSLLYDDIVAVEEAPEHALDVGDVPSLNEALDYFLKVMTVWGPGPGSSGAHLSSPSGGHR